MPDLYQITASANFAWLFIECMAVLAVGRHAIALRRGVLFGIRPQLLQDALSGCVTAEDVAAAVWVSSSTRAALRIRRRFYAILFLLNIAALLWPNELGGERLADDYFAFHAAIFSFALAAMSFAPFHLLNGFTMLADELFHAARIRRSPFIFTHALAMRAFEFLALSIVGGLAVIFSVLIFSLFNFLFFEFLKAAPLLIEIGKLTAVAVPFAFAGFAFGFIARERCAMEFEIVANHFANILYCISHDDADIDQSWPLRPRKFAMVTQSNQT